MHIFACLKTELCASRVCMQEQHSSVWGWPTARYMLQQQNMYAYMQSHKHANMQTCMRKSLPYLSVKRAHP